MAIRHKLAKYCTEMTFDALPGDIVEHTKLYLMDTLGVMAAGPKVFLEDFPDIVKFVKEQGGVPECSIIGGDGKVPCLSAALVNTAICINTSFDAIYKSTPMHLAGTLFPATIAVAERQKASGRDLILAIVVGTEIMARVGNSLGSRYAYARGFHPTSIAGPFGCAAAAGKLLRLSEGELAEALSIAGVQAAGSSVWAGEVTPFSWCFQMGKAAQSGVLAAMLAQKGFNGIDMIFEDERGILAAHSESPDPEKLTSGLGQTYEIKDLILNNYGVGLYIVTGVEALLEILEKHQISADDVEEITLRLPTTVIPLVGFPEYPDNRSGALKSSRYVLAVTAITGNNIATVEATKAEQRKDPRVIDLFSRVHVVGDPELDKVFPQKKPCVLALKTKNGQQFSQRNDGPFKGDPEAPLSEQDIEAKFFRMAEPALGQERANQILSNVRQLDRMDDISMLVHLLAS